MSRDNFSTDLSGYAGSQPGEYRAYIEGVLGVVPALIAKASAVLYEKCLLKKTTELLISLACVGGIISNRASQAK